MANTGSGTGLPIEAPEAITVAGPDHSGTALALDEFRQLMLQQVNPWHFWQLANNQKVPQKIGCSRLVYQYAWLEPSSVGRAEIVEAIRSAEAKLAEVLGYWPGERFESEELAYSLPFVTSWARVKAIGKEKLESLNTVNVVRSDPDGDQLEETFTLTIPVNFTNPDEVAVFFSSGDRLGEDISAKWQVKPVKVKIASGTATITGKAWMIVHPSKYERIDKPMIDPADANSFASTLDVYRRTVDTTDQGSFTWLGAPDYCCSGNTDPSGILSRTSRYSIVNAEAGSLGGGLATYNAGSGQWESDQWPTCIGAGRPAFARVNYLAGGPLTDHMKVMIARLAAAELTKPVCTCTEFVSELERWQVDLSRQPEEGDAYTLSQKDIDECPWGYRAGHIWTFREAKRHAIVRGFALG